MAANRVIAGAAGSAPFFLGTVRPDGRLPLVGVLVGVDHHGARGWPLRDACCGMCSAPPRGA